MRNPTLLRRVALWAGLGALALIPVGFAVTSPLLAWRDPIYIAAGLGGILALTLLMFQPLLVGGDLAFLTGRVGRRVHRWIGSLVIASVVLHVAGLWITSPPDVVDALLFASPTPFSVWGVIAMWALFATGVIVAMRRRAAFRPHIWRLLHLSLVLVVIAGTVAHALLNEGTMERVSRFILCVAVVAFGLRAFYGFGLPALRVVRRN